jgi:ribosomal protein S18 acetylase RimI-like enzyme
MRTPVIESPADTSRIAEPSVASALHLLYEEAFPASERVSFDELVEGVLAGAQQLHLVLDPKGVPVGFGISLDLAPILMLEYLAVDVTRRSLGVGGELLEAIESYARTRGYSGIVLEVERADASCASSDQRSRRIAFYRRHGAELVECAPDYRAPRLDGVAGTVAMALLWIPSAGERCPRGAELERTIRDIMAKSYELKPEDPVVRANLETLEC